jgi:transcriptional regulator with XRE-family HTH domain
MPEGEDPFVARKYLSDSLRPAREARALTQEEVARRLDWSHSKVVRIENGTVGLSLTDLRALLQLFNVTDVETVVRLEDAARIAKRRPWRKNGKALDDAGFAAYLSYEGVASAIMTFQMLTIPGLLQTPQYARAIFEANNASDVDDRLEVRLKRQSLLDGPDAPTLVCVMDEAALRRQVGGPSVMCDQLVSLRAAAERDTISVEVIPYSAGAYRSMVEPFTLLRSERWDEDVLFREGALRTVTDHEDHELIAKYQDRFDSLRRASLRGEAAISLIDAVTSELREAASTGRPPRTEQPG